MATPWRNVIQERVGTKKCGPSVVEKGIEAGVAKRNCSFSRVKGVPKLAPIKNMKLSRGEKGLEGSCSLEILSFSCVKRVPKPAPILNMRFFRGEKGLEGSCSHEILSFSDVKRVSSGFSL